MYIMYMYVLGREPPDNNVHTYMYVTYLSHMYVYIPTWYNRSQIIMYVRTYFGKEILIYPRNDIHMYVRIRTYLLGVIDPRNNVHMYVRTYLVPDNSMYIISGVY